MNSRLLLTLIAGAALTIPASAQMRDQDRAVRGCQDNIRARAMSQFHTDDVQFQDVRTGQNWVGGSVLVGEGQNASVHHFSCSTNDRGWVRSARIEGAPLAYNQGQRYGEAGRDMNAAAMDSCRSMVADRIRDQGDWDVRVNSIRVDPDGDHIVGFAQADGRYQPRESFRFSCRLDRNTGMVQSTDVTRR